MKKGAEKLCPKIVVLHACEREVNENRHGRVGILECRLNIRDIDHRPRTKRVTVIHLEVISIRPFRTGAIAIVSIVHNWKMPPRCRVEIR